MKRHAKLFPMVTDFANLLLAAHRAQRCKRYRPDVLAFNHDLEANLLRLQRDLLDKTYEPGGYRTFTIYEPKRRIISAAPYHDRVVHHALCNVIGPILDRSLSPCSYANRTGMGTHKALRRFITLAQQYRFVLKADVEKYFPTIDHGILKAMIGRKIKCPETLWLIDLILDNSSEPEPVEKLTSARPYGARRQSGAATPLWLRPGLGSSAIQSGVAAPLCRRAPHERRCGLPIGNLTSQLWANLYLNGLDHQLAARFGGRRYLRYVDDLALFSNDAGELEAARELMENEMAKNRLRLHPVKTQITEVRHGVNWLGFRVLPDRVRVRQENLKRARRRLRQMQRDYRARRISFREVTQSIQSWVSHLSYGDTWRLGERIFDSLVFSRG